MGKELLLLGSAIIGASSRSGRAELADLSYLFAPARQSRNHREEVEILRAHEYEEKIGRSRLDLIGDDLEMEEEEDDEESGYIGIADIIGAMDAAACGARLTKKQRKALKVAHRNAKAAAKAGNGGRGRNAELAEDLRAANRPIVLRDEENILRKLNMPLSTITVPANGLNSFAIVVQESMRLERLFLYPTGGNYDNLFVGDIFCGRQTNSVVPGNEEPMINYSPTAVDSGIEGFTVNYGLTLRISIRNGTGAPVVVGGKVKGRTLTS